MKKKNRMKRLIKKRLIILLLCLFSLPGFAQSNKEFIKSVELSGYIGTRVDDCILKQVMAQDVDHLVEPFKDKTEKSRWQSEFWGKWMLGACDAYRYNRNPALLKKMEYAVDELIKTQLPNGYIGNYGQESHLAQWDVWGRKYVMLGLQAFYKITGDKKALNACRKEADYLLSEVGPGLADIATIGNYKGMAAGSILEPMVYLYNNTKDTRYLDFAKYIVKQWETPVGSNLISKALEGVHVAKRFLPIPKAALWATGGHKSYEMMSCYVGLLELYKVTQNSAYLSAVEMTVNEIIENEINIVGGASSTNVGLKEI